MANYIKSEVLAEAYTHLEIDLYNDKVRLEQLKTELTNFFQERASFLFETSVEIKVEFEEGSLKTKIIAFGSAASVLTAVVGGYGDFRQSVTQLADDAASLAQSANLEVIFRTKTPYCDRLRIEKRKGVFGRVAALIGELDNVSTKVSDTRMPINRVRLHHADEAIDALITWDGHVDKLFAKFDTPDTSACVASGLVKELDKMPKSFPWTKELSGGEFTSHIVDSDTSYSAQVAATVARYESALKLVKKKMKERASIQVAKGD